MPEEQRIFPVQRAAQTVLIPKVIDYIDNYNGKFANDKHTDDVLNKVLGECYKIDDYQKLYDEGVKYYDDNSYLDALKFFNTARLIKETPEVILSIANILFSLNCFSKAIPLFEKVIELGGNKIEALRTVASCYDFIGDRCKMLLDDSEDGIDEKKYIYCVMFDIHILLKDKRSAREITDKIVKYSNDERVKKCIEEMRGIIKKGV